MKQTVALVLVFIALLAAASAWVAFSRASEADDSAPNDSIAQSDAPGTAGASPNVSAADRGGTVEQVIQKVLPQAPLAPEIKSALWLNSPALATQDLRGHVVVVEFWTHG